MGRMLGSFDPDDQLERPDLNKCPDCGCYFATVDCPLCGKTCPPEMRAGTRVEPKKKKRRGNSSGRVVFIPWYHSWWFILIMLWFMPVIGIILLVMSNNTRKTKVIVSVAAVGLWLLNTGIIGILLDKAFAKDPVNTKISQASYMEKCQTVDVETFYRSPQAEDRDEYVCMELAVSQKMFNAYVDRWSFFRYGVEEWGTVYICTSPENPDVTVIVRDCQIEKYPKNLLPGDRIRVYGQSAGINTVSVYMENDNHLWEHTEPCLFMAYVEVLQE